MTDKNSYFKKRRQSIYNILTFLSYIVIIIVFGGPLLWLVSTSLQSVKSIFAYPPHIIPESITFEAYVELFGGGGEITTYILNSLKLSTIVTLGTLLVTIPGAYALSKFKFKRKGLLLIVILLFQMISPLIITIPLYRYFNKLGLLNSHLGVILVYIAFLIPLITWMLKGFFDSIPRSIEESAMIDGCTRINSLIRITLPIASSGIVSSAIFAFLLSWSQFIIPFILLDSSGLLPISVGIYAFQGGRMAVKTNLVAAAAVTTIIPPVLLFMFLQRYVVRLLTAGAVKG